MDGKGALFIETVEGSPSNVAGLPVRLLLRLVREAGLDLGCPRPGARHPEPLRSRVLSSRVARRGAREGAMSDEVPELPSLHVGGGIDGHNSCRRG